MFRFFVSGVIAAALVTFVTPAFATDTGPLDKLAYLTFSAPVQVPGGTLNAGTYRFHLTNPVTSRNVMQVLSTDGTIVYGMFNTIADRRTSVTDDPIVTFRETPAGVAPAIRSLFYGAEYKGYEFVYGKGEPNMIARVVPVPATYTAIPAAPPAPEPSIEPAVAEVVAEAVPPAEEALPQAEPAVLPRTASPVPIIAVGSGASLLVGLGLALLRRRVW